MRVVMVLEDNEEGRPVYTEDVSGDDPEQTSMSYSILVILKMVMYLINSEYRVELVRHIHAMYRAMREGRVVIDQPSGDSKCH